MKKIVILGPESTGKTKLAMELAEAFNSRWVPEYAREYLNKQGGAYNEVDLLEIAKGQARIEREAISGKGEIIFFDTDLTVIKIWSKYKYGRCHRWIVRQLNRKSYDLYLLTYPDIPWTPDSLREHPQQRDKIFSIYLKELQNRNLPFKIIKGLGKNRLNKAASAVSNILVSG